MSARIEASLFKAMLAQRAVLQRMLPSAALDARFERSLETWRAQRLRADRRRRLTWALAAAATGVLVLSTGWLVMHVGERPASAVARDSKSAYSASEDAAVLRVRASLGAQLPVMAGNGSAPHPRHYWVDVGVASDGTLYIERVTPIGDDPQLFVP